MFRLSGPSRLDRLAAQLSSSQVGAYAALEADSLVLAQLQANL